MVSAWCKLRCAAHRCASITILRFRSDTRIRDRLRTCADEIVAATDNAVRHLHARRVHDRHGRSRAGMLQGVGARRARLLRSLRKAPIFLVHVSSALLESVLSSPTEAVTFSVVAMSLVMLTNPCADLLRLIDSQSIEFECYQVLILTFDLCGQRSSVARLAPVRVLSQRSRDCSGTVQH
jgi:hypothetical protein